MAASVCVVTMSWSMWKLLPAEISESITGTGSGAPDARLTAAMRSIVSFNDSCDIGGASPGGSNDFPAFVTVAIPAFSSIAW